MKLTAVMVSSYHPIPVICRAVSGRGIGQIDPLVNDHFSRLRPTIQGTAKAERPGQGSPARAANSSARLPEAGLLMAARGVKT
ncbi:MAG: hypothetical protein JWO75_2876 [Actinomycetia bacterium]|nr:hypothetical protein [Actinomycetes bacterium]